MGETGPPEPFQPDGTAYAFLVTFKDDRLVIIEIETDGDPYRLCIQFIHFVGAHSIRQGELKDKQGRTMMLYTPGIGWFFGGARDNPLP